MDGTVKQSRFNVWAESDQHVYVFNGISGALLQLSRREYLNLLRFLETGEASECSPQLLEQLALGRMIVSDDFDEVEHLRSVYQASRYSAARFALTIVTSLGCNFDCPYCFEAKHPSILNEDVEEQILQVLEDQLCGIKDFHVTWFGGEPLVGKKPLLSLSDAFIQRCDSAGVNYSASIITNGFLLSNETCRQLADRRVTRVQVGLDGPPEVHNRMRPLAGGKGSFVQILRNLHYAVNHFSVSVRVNLDRHNLDDVEGLFRILAAEGLNGKLAVYPAQIVSIDQGTPTPSAFWKPACLTKREFSDAEQSFFSAAQRYGFNSQLLPKPTATPCTAVRANELVVGSKGELYKCWDSVGSPSQVIGHIRDYRDLNGRLQRWLKYDPFANAECRACIALPVCMGGCASHAMDPGQYDNRCGTFRHNYRERVLTFATAASRRGAG